MLLNQKSKIRKDFQLKRLSLDLKVVNEKSKKINQNFIDNFLPLISPLNHKIFALYQPINNEVNLDLISAFLIKNNIAFSLPKIIKKDRHLDFVLIKKETKYTASNFYPKIIEPELENNILESVIPDVVLVPLIAFDDNLSRVGMGAGFYDRTIKFLKNKKKIISVGLAYDFQKFDGVLAIEDHDCSLDFIVSESKILQNFF